MNVIHSFWWSLRTQPVWSRRRRLLDSGRRAPLKDVELSDFLLAAVERDFSQGVEASTAPLVRDRGERLRGLKDYVLNAAGRIYVQQLVIVEFKVLNSFRQELSRLIAQDLSEEMRREQEQRIKKIPK